MNAKKIPLRQRMSFLPSLFGNYFLTGEAFVFGFMDKYAQGYNGGHYEFMKAENGAMYLKPDSDYFLSLPNYFNETVSADICGIIATSYALSWLIHKAHVNDNDRLFNLLLDRQQKLNDYIGTLNDRDYDRVKFAIN
ncbi:antirestriction protein [Klebsiella quasipneumoniae]|uniref:antirestriction protein n=1 Tax=Klebsiella quasipneumoniae TaxID=1463165 RepID=UPI001C953F33|nr:antirestriction protein [Klebsiella quasipneumoniae]MBY5246620.1 antirestriction protein [Klebsiella quasipneumoniae]